MSLTLMWFRSDLRVHDNTALHMAARRGPVVAVFLRSMEQWQQHGHGANKITFWLQGANALGKALAEYNIPLLHRHVPTFDAAPGALLALAEMLGATSLYFNREYPWNEWQRDQAVINSFRHAGLDVQSFRDTIAFEPGELTTGKGDFYSVFTPFSRAWHRSIEASRLNMFDAPACQSLASISADPEPELPALSTHSVATQQWVSGEQEASNHLHHFLSQQVHRYARDRDFPGMSGTSLLSPYLSLGMISYRQCMQAAMAMNEGLLTEGNPGLATWVKELIWREFYQHVAFGFPRVCKGRAFQPHTEMLAWRNDPEDFAAWCEGRTGYPIIDAAMRQLRETGWMHNRLRMITAMFLTKHLLTDWRKGEAFFLHHLVDGDFAANNGGWQWAASTGTDAAPYFRIFNPTTQSKRFDPDGQFIGHWLPQLRELPAKQRHAPDPALLSRAEYPFPIVDHRAARLRALEAFKALS
uniref:deoxyribodipyrimidine photo-lyase n=1 Tax=Halomonas sp. TaxID=1486246 RepID=UPI00262AF6D9|nr:deoxyribodipyrimidine photo-lyase [Halomonas sp.]